MSRSSLDDQGESPVPETARQSKLSGLRIERDSDSVAPRRMGGSRWLPWVALLLLVLVAGSAAWRWHFSILPVTLARATVLAADENAELVAASGHLTARRRTTISPETLQILVDRQVEAGQQVEEGQVLGRLEHAELEASLAELAVRIEEAKREESRQQELADQGLTQTANLEAATFARRALEAQQQVLEARIEKTFLRAPFAGTVTHVEGDVGSILGPAGFSGREGVSAGSLCSIADLQTLEAEINVSEVNIHAVRAGLPVRLELAAFPGEAFAGLVHQILPRADRQRATVPVVVHLREVDPRLVPGLSVQAVILREDSTTRRAEALVTAPVNALRINEQHAVAFVHQEGAVQRVFLEVGAQDGNRVIVVEGLTGGEQLVVDPPPELADGDRVRVRE